jgi:cell division protein ZapB
LTRPHRLPIVPPWTTDDLAWQLQRALLVRIEDAACHRMPAPGRTKTAACASSRSRLAGERSQLLAKNEQARSRVEAMISAAEVAGAAHMSTPESGKSEPVSIRVLDREYTVGVSPTNAPACSRPRACSTARMRECAAATAWSRRTAWRCWPR